MGFLAAFCQSTYESVSHHYSSCYEYKGHHGGKTNSHTTLEVWCWHWQELKEALFLRVWKPLKPSFVPSCKYYPTKQDLLALGLGRAQRKLTVFSKAAVHRLELNRLVRSDMSPLLPKTAGELKSGDTMS